MEETRGTLRDLTVLERLAKGLARAYSQLGEAQIAYCQGCRDLSAMHGEVAEELEKQEATVALLSSTAAGLIEV